jgi:hypothetical protein
MCMAPASYHSTAWVNVKPEGPVSPWLLLQTAVGNTKSRPITITYPPTFDLALALM